MEQIHYKTSSRAQHTGGVPGKRALHTGGVLFSNAIELQMRYDNTHCKIMHYPCHARMFIINGHS